jgi:hypothetical protein
MTHKLKTTPARAASKQNNNPNTLHQQRPKVNPECRRLGDVLAPYLRELQPKDFKAKEVADA